MCRSQHSFEAKHKLITQLNIDLSDMFKVENFVQPFDFHSTQLLINWPPFCALSAWEK
jgi:hypothetical protein